MSIYWPREDVNELQDGTGEWQNIQDSIRNSIAETFRILEHHRQILIQQSESVQTVQKQFNETLRTKIATHNHDISTIQQNIQQLYAKLDDQTTNPLSKQKIDTIQQQLNEQLIHLQTDITSRLSDNAQQMTVCESNLSQSQSQIETNQTEIQRIQQSLHELRSISMSQPHMEERIAQCESSFHKLLSKHKTLIHDKWDDFQQQMYQQIHQISQTIHTKIESMKQTIQERPTLAKLQTLLDGKANKQSVAEALHRKENKEKNRSILRKMDHRLSAAETSQCQFQTQISQETNKISNQMKQLQHEQTINSTELDTLRHSVHSTEQSLSSDIQSITQRLELIEQRQAELTRHSKNQSFDTLTHLQMNKFIQAVLASDEMKHFVISKCQEYTKPIKQLVHQSTEDRNSSNLTIQRDITKLRTLIDKLQSDVMDCVSETKIHKADHDELQKQLLTIQHHIQEIETKHTQHNRFDVSLKPSSKQEMVSKSQQLPMQEVSTQNKQDKINAFIQQKSPTTRLKQKPSTTETRNTKKPSHTNTLKSFDTFDSFEDIQSSDDSWDINHMEHQLDQSNNSPTFLDIPKQFRTKSTRTFQRTPHVSTNVGTPSQAFSDSFVEAVRDISGITESPEKQSHSKMPHNTTQQATENASKRVQFQPYVRNSTYLRDPIDTMRALAQIPGNTENRNEAQTQSTHVQVHLRRASHQ